MIKDGSLYQMPPGSHVHGGDPEKMAQLPSAAGLRNEVLVQPSHRHVYDHAVRMTGAKLIEVETRQDLESALSRPEVSVDLGRAPSEGLVLWAISHSDFESPFSDRLPPPAAFSRRPSDPREYRRWLSMSHYEMGTLLEREWLSRLN